VNPRRFTEPLAVNDMKMPILFLTCVLLDCWIVPEPGTIFGCDMIGRVEWGTSLRTKNGS
jgi:hypothetical protein